MTNNFDNDFAGLHSMDGERIALQSVHINGQLEGLLLQMTVRQSYRNQTGTNIETVYTFPLPWGASLMGMDVEINGRRLAAAVVGKPEAIGRYEKAIDDGDTPVMVEQSAMGLFSANLGNLKDGEEAVIEVRYVQLQRFEQDNIRLMVPTTIAPRFGDGYAEGGLALHESAASNLLVEYPFTLKLHINDTPDHAALHSPSHTIITKRENGTLQTSLTRGSFLDRDFILNLSGLRARSFAICAQDGEYTSVMASFCPQLSSYSHKPLALKILVDCSGSMAGDSMHAAKRALHQVLQELSEDDAISYSKFGNEVDHSFLQMQRCTPTNLKQIATLVSETNADMGGTETYSALMSTFRTIDSPVAANSAARAIHILMITDGSIWNNQQVIEASKNSNHRIFPICVGSAANDNLIRELAEQTGGACEMVGPNENIEQAIVRTFHRMRHAESMELNVDWGTDPLWESTMPFGVFHNDTVHVFARFSSQPTQAPILMWSGANQIGNVQAEILSQSDDKLVPRIVASWQIKNSTSAEERLALALQYQLVTDRTSLILVHRRPEEDKAKDLPQLQQIAHMQAAGSAGSSKVSRQSLSAMPAAWRRTSTSETERSMERIGPKSYDVPAFLRRQPGTNIVPVAITPLDLLKRFSASGKVSTWIYGVGRNLEKNALPDAVTWVIDSLEIILGSREKAWSLFIDWLSRQLSYSLPRHAERAVRKEIASLHESERVSGFHRIEADFPELSHDNWAILVTP